MYFFNSNTRLDSPKLHFCAIWIHYSVSRSPVLAEMLKGKIFFSKYTMCFPSNICELLSLITWKSHCSCFERFIQFNWKTYLNSKRVTWSGGGGGVEDPQKIRTDYREPTPVQSWQRSPTLARSSWVFAAQRTPILIGSRVFRVFGLDFEWLPETIRVWAKSKCVRQCIMMRIDNRHCISIGYRFLQCLKIGS